MEDMTEHAVNKETFGRGLKKLCAYYERSIPGRDTTDLWISKLDRIPNECMDWMVKIISDRHETFPRNLTNVMLQLWPEWLNHHPDKRTSRDGCNDCDAEGWLRVRDREGRVLCWRCKCGKCRADVPSAWLSELMMDGYELDTFDLAMQWNKIRISEWPERPGHRGNINWSHYLEGVV